MEGPWHHFSSQMKQFQKAASAAFTYLVEHPKDTVMLTNLKYYSTMDGVDMREIVNFEAKVCSWIIFRFWIQNCKWKLQ